jgi:hyaluronoglucosaminidase
MHFEMHLGPIIGRDAELPKYARGMIANCMEYAECSKIPLITVADYLWDGDTYAPVNSWNKAVNEVIGPIYADAFTLFADHLKTSCLMDDNSTLLKSAFCAVSRAVRAHDYSEAVSVVNDYTALQTECLKYLDMDLPICGELRAWTVKYNVAAKIIILLFKYLLNGNTPSLKQEAEALLSEYNAIPEKLAEDIIFREVLMNRY